MPVYMYLIIAAGTILWVAPFFVFRTKGETLVRLDKRARWGLLLKGIAYSLLWQGSFWERSPQWWRVAATIMLLALACVISWGSARALGRQFRFDAGVNAGHQLVRSGPYRFVRHPIYTSMFGILLATGFAISTPDLMVAAVALFLVGATIRMRVEDSLLESHFGSEFAAYKKHVSGMIPFLM